MPTLLVIQRLLLSAVLAGCVGYERERHGRAAGLRTHILVGVGSALIMLTALYLMEALAGRQALDPTRMAAQVVSGIGFLGAGTILRFRASIRGLTTAASLWAVAGIGLAIGSGFVVGAVTATAIVLLALFGLGNFERGMRKDWYRILVVDTRASSEALAKIRHILSDYEVEIRDLEIKPTDQPDVSIVELHVKLLSQHDEPAIVNEILRLEGTRRAHWA
ncbi:MAG: MgtC/SapB family protein [Candidatus Omnitrophica bacterium]|nr:MgtC/SapB family protein [Candidatus Omnitrophota bacterium]